MNRVFGHPYALLALAATLWGANAVVGRAAVGHVSPMMLTFLRWGAAILILLPFALPQLRRDWPTVRANLIYLGLLGAFGMTAFNGLLYAALTHTTAVQATLVQSAMPLVVFAGMFLCFGVRVLPVQLLGFALTAAGVALTAARGDPATLLSLQLNRGDVLMIAATLIYGSYTVALGLKPKLHWLTMILVLSLAAFAAAFPLVMWEVASGSFIAPDAAGWSAVLFTAIFPSILAQIFYIRGVELIGANRANLFINLVPITGAGMALLFLREALLPYHLVALALVVAGIVIAERARHVRADRPAP